MFSSYTERIPLHYNILNSEAKQWWNFRCASYYSSLLAATVVCLLTALLTAGSTAEGSDPGPVCQAEVGPCWALCATAVLRRYSIMSLTSLWVRDRCIHVKTAVQVYPSNQNTRTQHMTCQSDDNVPLFCPTHIFDNKTTKGLIFKEYVGLLHNILN